MNEDSTAILRGLLQNPSGSASPKTSFIESSRLRQSLRSTRNWMLVLLLFCLCGFGQVIFVTMIDLFRINRDNSYLLGIGFLVLTVPLLLPLGFMGIYVFKLHDFLKHGQPEQFVRMLVAQRWMWTVLGIYAGLFIVLTGLMIFVLLSTLLPFGF